MFRCYSYTIIIREHINSFLLKLQLIKLYKIVFYQL